MNKLCITFPLLYRDVTLPPEANIFTDGTDREYVIFLYEKFADRILGFIVRHDYNREAAEEILVKVFTIISENLSLYQPCDRLLVKLMGVAAQYIRGEKLIIYSCEPGKLESLPV